MLLVTIQTVSLERSESVMDDLIGLSRGGISNRASMDEADVVGIVLGWLREIPDDDTHRTLSNQAVELLRMSSRFSISGNNLRMWLSLLQMKSEGRCPPHYRALLRTLREATTKEEASRAFFHFAGTGKSGILRRGRMAWPSQRAITFAT